MSIEFLLKRRKKKNLGQQVCASDLNYIWMRKKQPAWGKKPLSRSVDVEKGVFWGPKNYQKKDSLADVWLNTPKLKVDQYRSVVPFPNNSRIETNRGYAGFQKVMQHIDYVFPVGIAQELGSSES